MTQEKLEKARINREIQSNAINLAVELNNVLEDKLVDPILPMEIRKNNTNLNVIIPKEYVNAGEIIRSIILRLDTHIKQLDEEFKNL